MTRIKWPTKVRVEGGDRIVYRKCPYCKTEFCNDNCLASALDEIVRLANECKRLHKMLAKLEAQLKKEMRRNEKPKKRAKSTSGKAPAPGNDFVARWTKVIASL